MHATGELSGRNNERESGCAAARRGSRASYMEFGLGIGATGRKERKSFTVTPGYPPDRARRGKRVNPVKRFGTDTGVVNPKNTNDEPGNPIPHRRSGFCTPNSRSRKDVIIIGDAHRSGGSHKGKTKVKRLRCAASTSRRPASTDFHTIPKPGELELEYNTWGKTIRPITPATRSVGPDEGR